MSQTPRVFETGHTWKVIILYLMTFQIRANYGQTPSGTKHNCLDLASKVNISFLSKTISKDSLNRIFLNYFDCYRRLPSYKSTSDTEIAQYDFNYKKFIGLWPFDRNTPLIRLNQGHLLKESNRTSQAIVVYKKLIEQFDGSTRIGSEARYYLGNCYSKQKHFRQAIQVFREIRSNVFIATLSQTPKWHMAKSAYRLADIQAKKRDTAQAVQFLTEAISYLTQSVLRDSLQFILSDYQRTLGDTVSSCETLALIAKSESAGQLGVNALFNKIIFQCHKKGGNETADSFYITSWKSLSKNLERNQKKVVLETILEEIIQEQNSIQLLNWLNYSSSDTFEKAERTENILIILRQAITPNFQQTIIQWLDSAFKAQNDFPSFDYLSPLSNEIQLYKNYFRYTQGKPIKNLDTLTLSHKWENALYQLLKGIILIQLNISQDYLSANLIEKVQSYFTEIGNQNSELAFEAAFALLAFYIKLSEPHTDNNQSSFESIGYHFIGLKFIEKAKKLVTRIQRWQIQLPHITLHPNTMSLINNIQKKSPLLDSLANEHWERLALQFAKLPRDIQSKRNELAFNGLINRLERLIQNIPIPSQQCYITLITASLVWYHLKTTPIFEKDRYDQQARAAQKIFDYIEKFMGKASKIQQSQIGRLFGNSIPKDKLTRCFYLLDKFNRPPICAPISQQFPSPQSFIRQIKLNPPKPPAHTKRYFQFQKYVLMSSILVESHKIRNIKTRINP